jgi:hypothetical protein
VLERRVRPQRVEPGTLCGVLAIVRPGEGQAQPGHVSPVRVDEFVEGRKHHDQYNGVEAENVNAVNK